MYRVSDNGGTDVIPFPEFDKLKSDVEKSRVELSMLVLERDELEFIECKNIETAYMLAVGGLEYKAYEIECAVLRLKRKIDLIQSKKNRQEKVILFEIEEILNIEFVEYQAKLNEQLEKMNSAIERSRGKFLSIEETRELKKLYRIIVKALHPDIHPDQNDTMARLFQNAADAYKNGDINGLRIIAVMVAEPVSDEKSDPASQLIREKERLSVLIKAVKDRITEIKSEYPYTMKGLIDSPGKTEARKNELTETINKLNETLAAYTEKINKMLR